MDKTRILDWLADLEDDLAECEETRRELDGLRSELAAKASNLRYVLEEMDAAIRKIRQQLEGDD